MKRKTAKKGATIKNKGGVVQAAVGAAVELGHAAESLQDSWEHIKKAQARGQRVTHKAKQVGKRAIKSARRMVGAVR